MRLFWSRRHGPDGPWLRPMLATVLLLALAAALSLWWTLHQVRVLAQPGQDQDVWHAVNVQRELQRLQQAAESLPVAGSSELALRLEVLVGLLKPGQGTPRNGLSLIDQLPQTRERMDSLGQQVLQWADHLRAGGPPVAAAVADDVRARAAWLHATSDQATLDLHLANTERADAERLVLRHRFALLSWVLGGLVLGLLAMIVRLYAEARRSQRLVDHMAVLNRRLESRVERRTRQLVEGKALLNFILDASPSEVALLNAQDGRLHFINQRFRDRLGQGAQGPEPVGRLSLRELFQAPPRGEHFADELEAYGRVDAVEAQFSGRGQEWVSLSAQLIELEGQLAHLVWCYDITAHKQLEAQLRALATTDVLSGLDNRRAFFDKGTQLLEQARRYQHPISLLMLDIDHFKRINDEHGHACGDEAIRRVAQLLRRVLREADLIARVGGEEFCALLPETALEPAREAAQRLIDHMRVADLGHSVHGPLAGTLSIGVAQLQGPRQTLDQLMHEADAALYRAKSGGRDQLAVSPLATTSQPPVPQDV